MTLMIMMLSTPKNRLFRFEEFRLENLAFMEIPKIGGDIQF